MNWSQTPRTKKILFLTLAVLVVAIGLAVISVTGGAGQPSADSNAPVLDTNYSDKTITVKVAVADNAGKPAPAFVDALAADSTCTTVPSDTAGYTATKDAEADGTTEVVLPVGAYYVLRATSTEGISTGETAIYVGPGAANSCAKQVSTDTADAVAVKFSK